MSRIFTSIAASLDGYIASGSGDLSWLNNSMVKGEDYGFEETMGRTGIFVMGANTYREMLASKAAGGKDQAPIYVITRDKSLKKGTRTTLYGGDLKGLAERLKSETDRDIYIWGGGSLVSQFIDLGLLDELNLAFIPVLLGGGVPLFRKMSSLRKLRLVYSRHFEKSGIVLLKYELQPSQRSGSL